MKRTISIAFALLILISGIHFSIDTHFCGNRVTGVLWSFSGKKVSCGMESESCPAQNGMHEKCCHDLLASFVFDEKYCFSSDLHKVLLQKQLNILFASVNLKYQFLTFFGLNKRDADPENMGLPTAVNLPKICTFRI